MTNSGQAISLQNSTDLIAEATETILTSSLALDMFKPEKGAWRETAVMSKAFKVSATSLARSLGCVIGSKCAGVFPQSSTNWMPAP